jgi:membrane protein implicated in regulation of membrane protease activity
MNPDLDAVARGAAERLREAAAAAPLPSRHPRRVARARYVQGVMLTFVVGLAAVAVSHSLMGTRVVHSRPAGPSGTLASATHTGAGPWPVLWFVAAGVFLLLEIRHLRLFFFPLAVGAVAAAVTALAHASQAVQVAVFAAVAAVALVSLRPVARRLARTAARSREGVDRWVGREAEVVEAVPAHGSGGWIRLGRELWRASSGLGVAIPAGVIVFVTAVEGTRLIVVPLEPLMPSEPEQGEE